MYSRRDPYEGEDAQEVCRLVADKKVIKRPPVPRHMPPPIQSLMADCLVEDPSQRPSADELDLRLKRVDVKSIEPTQSQSSRKSGSISLFDIFPRHIAEALRDGKEVEAEHRDCVTIFFSDSKCHPFSIAPYRICAIILTRHLLPISCWLHNHLIDSASKKSGESA